MMSMKRSRTYKLLLIRASRGFRSKHYGGVSADFAITLDKSMIPTEKRSRETGRCPNSQKLYNHRTHWTDDVLSFKNLGFGILVFETNLALARGFTFPVVVHSARH